MKNEKERTHVRLNGTLIYNLEILAKNEDRTMVEEVKFLVQERLKAIGEKWKK